LREDCGLLRATEPGDQSALREIYHKLAEAREIAEGLEEGTIGVIDAAKDHVCREFVAATEIWDGMLE
jgi:hypothetical protein